MPAILALALIVPESAAARIHCRSTIKEDTTLHRDLRCNEIGLRIGADDVTLDLNGHTIDSGLDSVSVHSVGIKNAGKDDVTIKNGVIGSMTPERFRGFVNGILLKRHADESLVRHVKFAGNRTGMQVSRSSGARIRDVSTIGHTGISLTRANHVRIARMKAKNVSYAGLTLDHSSHNVVRQIKVYAGQCAICISHSDQNRLARVRVTLSGGDGAILLGHSDQNVIKGSHLRGDPGITLQARSDRNLVADNDLGRILVGELFDPGLSRGNLIARNDTGGVIARGGSSAHTTIVGNTTFGITVEAGAGNTVVKRNTATDSLGDGIYVGSPSATVTGNLATDNAGHGINAVSGVTDGGGNRAAGNGTLPQCVNIVCTPP